MKDSNKRVEGPDEADAAVSGNPKAKLGDTPTMATSSGNAQSREVDAKLNTDTPTVPGNFHEFGGSATTQFGDTYEKRMMKIASALGNKAPLVS